METESWCWPSVTPHGCPLSYWGWLEFLLPQFSLVGDDAWHGMLPGTLEGERTKPLEALGMGARGEITLDASLRLRLSEMRRFSMVFGLELGELRSTGGGWTSARSQESYTQHGEGEGT